MSSDIVVVGGGVIGLSIAWELAGAGLTVQVLDQSEIGSEASWAGAGMIPPGDPCDPLTHQLAVLSDQYWPVMTAALRSETSLSNEYHRCGSLLFAEGDGLEKLAESWRSLHVPLEIVGETRIREIEPAMATNGADAVWLPDMAQVRNPLQVKLLQAGCLARGVRLHTNSRVSGWKSHEGRIVAAVTESAEYSACEFVIAAGAWTPHLLAPLQLTLPIEPVHGQIVLLKTEPGRIRGIVEYGKRYLVPRLDGHVLVGATEERIGFEKRNTPEAVSDLMKFAGDVFPELAGQTPVRTWSGLRPWCGRGRPVLGGVPDYRNLFLAAGHFRAGLSNSPGTALVMRQLILGEPPTIDLAPFAF